jgi:hypothetical protein
MSPGITPASPGFLAGLAEGEAVSGDEMAELLGAAKPMLVYFGLVEQLQQGLKPVDAKNRTARSALEEGDPEEDWVKAMLERLMDLPTMLHVRTCCRERSLEHAMDGSKRRRYCLNRISMRYLLTC